MKDKEKGGYVDFCSLYPDVLKYQKYPTGHPIHIVENFLPKDICVGKCDMIPCPGFHWKIPYFGIIVAKILLPARLVYPILPIRVNGKLMFPLRIKCSMLHSNNSCICSDEERC